jgi:septal ring factor EnvC (AmiA/AmiB activator)
VAEGSPDIEERDQATAYRDYISDMLAELAELAGAQGDRRLALTLQLAALDAARSPPLQRAG